MIAGTIPNEMLNAGIIFKICISFLIDLNAILISLVPLKTDVVSKKIRAKGRKMYIYKRYRCII